MSHFTTLKTKIVVKEYLLKALEDLSYDWQEGNLEVKDYYGNRQQVQVKLKASEIGFQQQDNSYDIVADWYGIKDIKQEQFVQQLTQRYAYNAVKEQLKEDFTFVQEEIAEDKTIHISVRRIV